MSLAVLMESGLSGRPFTGGKTVSDWVQEGEQVTEGCHLVLQTLATHADLPTQAVELCTLSLP